MRKYFVHYQPKTLDEMLASSPSVFQYEKTTWWDSSEYVLLDGVHLNIKASTSIYHKPTVFADLPLVVVYENGKYFRIL